MRCTNQPVSWLTLERYHLSELDASEMRRVAAHLEACSACEACSRTIESDVRALPPLPEVTAPHYPRLWTRPRLAFGLATLAAAVLVAVLLVPYIVERRETPPDRLAYKGGELALTVVRERRGAISENPSRYLTGDRFRLLVTVPGADAMNYDVAVFQSGQVYFPYDERESIGPGNRIPIPGAFRLTGGDSTEICVFVGRQLPSRLEVERHGKRALPRSRVCHVLTAP